MQKLARPWRRLSSQAMVKPDDDGAQEDDSSHRQHRRGGRAHRHLHHDRQRARVAVAQEQRHGKLVQRNDEREDSARDDTGLDERKGDREERAQR